jgi:hypothetical protein
VIDLTPPPPRWTARAALGLAAACGYAVHQARRPARFLPELAGLGLVSWGAAMVYTPAGVIAAGISLILVGSRIPR